MVQEAPVGGERVVDVGREGSDQGVSQHDSPHEVPAEGVGDRLTDRTLDQVAPQPVVADGRAGLGAGEKRFRDGGEERLREARCA